MEKWCIEYSMSQNCFHVDELEQIIIRNRTNVTKNILTDFLIIALADTEEQALNKSRGLRNRFEERENF